MIFSNELLGKFSQGSENADSRFHQMANAAPVLIWETDTNGVVFVNGHYLEFFGVSNEDIIGMGWAKFLHPDDLQGYIDAYVKAFQERKSYAYECRFLRKDGQWRWLRNSGGPIDNNRFVGCSFDVTDMQEARKLLQTQETLRESEARYRALFENIDEGFCVIEFIDGPYGPLSDYVHIEANPAYMRHSGIADIVGKTGRGELTTSEADLWVATFRRVLETGEPARFERGLEATDRYLEVSCMRIGLSENRRVAIVFQDISLRKRVEKKLQQLNETLESQVIERTRERDRMWENSIDLMLVVDFEGYFRRVNPAWTALLGYQVEELIGHHVNEFVLPQFQDAAVDAYTDAAHGKNLNVVNCYRHKDGSVRWISWTAAPDRDVIYATGRDITVEREQTAALAKIEEVLRQSQKMEAVGQLTGGLAHDFNNLLAGITGALQLMEIRMQQGRYSDFDRYIAMAQGASKRAAALTHRLLAFSRQQTLTPKPTNVNRLVADMHELIQRTVGPSIPIEVVGASNAWAALVDASQLENALLNLCINARDAMPDGGRITIETANKWFDEAAARRQSMEQGQYLSLCVTDTGAGMSKEVIARV